MPSMKTMKFNHLVGKEVGTAILKEELARGGMAVIFKAFQKTLKREIAVKILPKSLMTPQTADLFQQEAETAAILSHPNIITIYEVGDGGEFIYFTMQLVDGRPLYEYIKKSRGNAFSMDRKLFRIEIIMMVMQILDALDYAHSQDIIHRDVKPSNVIIENHTSRPIIMDFGIAALTRGPVQNWAQVMGTPIYMSPEQIMNDTLDARADVYSTGVMLFEMLVGKLPLPAFSNPENLLLKKLSLQDDFFQKRPSELNPSIDKGLENVLIKATRFDKVKRYPSCRDFKARLDAYLKLNALTKSKPKAINQ